MWKALNSGKAVSITTKRWATVGEYESMFILEYNVILMLYHTYSIQNEFSVESLPTADVLEEPEDIVDKIRSM